MTENEVWTIDELVALTEVVQTGTTDFNGKDFVFQYCELTEGEEPKFNFPGAGASQDKQNEAYKKIGESRIVAMIEKANKMNPEGATVSEDNWGKLPSTIRWGVSNVILGSADDINFRKLDEGGT